MEYSFILVEPKVPENIGASARALMTMGFTSLILVKPCKDPEDRARWLAHGSHTILDNALTFETLAEAIVGFDLVIATTTRKRKVQSDLIPVKKLADFIARKGPGIEKIALVFGNEESGLSNSDLSLCDVSSTIPLKVDFPSLNLAQSVMIYSYELSPAKSRPLKEVISTNIGAESLTELKKKIERILVETDLNDKPALSGKILERLAHADGKDLNLIHSIAGKVLDLINKNK
jgi:tRNA/rRNA methyltransferase